MPSISTPGGRWCSRAGIWVFVMLDLGPFYVKLRVDALFSYSQALNRVDFEAERQTSPNFEPPTSNAIPRTSNQPEPPRRRLPRLLPGFESSRLPISSRCELRI